LSKDTVKIEDFTLSKETMHEEQTLATFYAKYHPQIRSYITSRINSSADADDLTQDVFIEFWKGNSPQDPKTYIFAIARKLISRYCRNRRKQPRTVWIRSVDEIATSCDLRKYQNQVEQISPTELKKLIEDAVAQLPPKACEAIRLRFIEGLSSKEAAQKAGCSVGAFWKRLQRAGKTLRQIRRKTEQWKREDAVSSYVDGKSRFFCF